MSPNLNFCKDTTDDAIFVIKVSLVCLSLGLAALTVSRLAQSDSDYTEDEDPIFSDYRTVTAFVLVIWHVFFHSFSNLAMVGVDESRQYGEPCYKEFSRLFTIGRKVLVVRQPGDECYAMALESK
jgi:hypothetical protein